jgi:hypothetical protein
VLRPSTTKALAVLAPLLLSAAASLAGCGGPEPKMMVANKKDDGVAANSASEERLANDGKPKTTSAPAEELAQPLTTPMGGGDSSSAGPGGAAGGGATGGSAAGGSGKGSGKKGDPKVPEKKEPKGAGGKVSKAECKQLFDKYIDLTLASDTRFEGIPPEMITQLKEQALSQAQSQKGDPCSTQDVSRQQYNCAIAAPTTQAWQRCMK